LGGGDGCCGEKQSEPDNLHGWSIDAYAESRKTVKVRGIPPLGVKQKRTEGGATRRMNGGGLGPELSQVSKTRPGAPGRLEKC
jgi:hypothetical protein